MVCVVCNIFLIGQSVLPGHILSHIRKVTLTLYNMNFIEYGFWGLKLVYLVDEQALAIYPILMDTIE